MSQSELNNNLNEKLGEYSSEIDHLELWSSIEDRVPKKKKRRGALWIWSGLGMILLLFISLYAFNSFESDQKDVEYTQTTSKGIIDGSEAEISSEQIDAQSAENIELNLDQETNNIKHISTKSIGQLVKTENSEKSISQENLNSNNNNKKYQKQTTPQFNNSITQQFNNSPTQKFNNSPTQQLDNSSTQQLDNSSIRQLKNSSTQKLELLSQPISLLTAEQRKMPRKSYQLKRIKKNHSHELSSQNWQVKYYAGSFDFSQQLAEDNKALVNDGNPYFNQGVEFNYNYQFSSKFYLTGAINYDVKYNLFEAEVQRDTIVPSSKGEQLLSTNEYINGGIDNLSGIPEVSALIQRSVKKLNTIKTLNIGLGAGYNVKLFSIRGYIEGQLLRSIYTNRSGLGILNKEQKITNISNLENLYTDSPQYSYQLGAGLDYPIYKNVSIVGGIQYRKGMTSLIPGERGTAYYSSVNGVIGVRLLVK